ncbi:hypothetical protein Sgleb_03210 [Streptomyces glebosus]|uniref:Uncharacterized protein n=1 Tax=Streptomyces glebosus TaxID=249580 RepID=A0A640SN05_9ACTN|nr:hypothetical protein Sgleb_03210 [Streptomyces glebosus]GHG72181.1 hypothetical protein GCM10010513_44780 [Streptomyces glebosus]
MGDQFVDHGADGARIDVRGDLGKVAGQVPVEDGGAGHLQGGAYDWGVAHGDFPDRGAVSAAVTTPTGRRVG